MTGTSGPVEPDAFVGSLLAELDRLASAGGFLAIVLHPFMLAWLGEEELERLLGHLAAAAAKGAVELARCEEAAARVLANPASLGGGASLDTTSWA